MVVILKSRNSKLWSIKVNTNKNSGKDEHGQGYYKDKERVTCNLSWLLKKHLLFINILNNLYLNKSLNLRIQKIIVL